MNADRVGMTVFWCIMAFAAILAVTAVWAILHEPDQPDDGWDYSE